METTKAPIIIELIRGNSRTKEPYAATCLVNGKRYRTTGSCYGGGRLLYRMITLLAYDGYTGRPVEVWDDKSPTGRREDLALSDHARSYLRADLSKDGVFSRHNMGIRVMPKNEALADAA